MRTQVARRIKMRSLALALSMPVMAATTIGAQAGILPSPTEKPFRPWSMVYGTEAPNAKSPSVKLFGVIQPGYAYDKQSGLSQFQFYRVRPGLRGMLTPNVNYYFLAEFARNGATLDYLTNPNGTQTQDFHGARLLSASVTLNYFSGVHIQLGQMLVPFEQAGITAAGVVPWINYTDGTANIAYREGLGDNTVNAGRQLGAMAFDQFTDGLSSFDYAVGLFNGTGLSQHDTNKNKLAVGHLGAAYGPFSAAAGVLSGNENVANGNLRRTKYSVDLHYGNYIKDRAWLWGEYLHTNEEQPGTTANRKARSWFVAGGIRPTRHTEALLRYSRYTPDTAANEHVNMLSVVGTLFRAHGIRYMLEYDHRTFSGTSKPNDERVNVMVSIPFGFRLLHG